MATPMHDDEFEAKLLRRLAEADDATDDTTAELADDDADLLAMHHALSSYRRESMDWAEARSATMPSPLPAGERGRRSGWLQAPQWALGTAAFCACILGGAVYTHHQASLAERMAAALPAAPTRQALAADNQLLSSVDDALRGSMAPTEQELGLTDNLLGESAPTRRHTQQRTN